MINIIIKHKDKTFETFDTDYLSQKKSRFNLKLNILILLPPDIITRSPHA